VTRFAVITKMVDDAFGEKTGMAELQDTLKAWMNHHVVRLGGPTKVCAELQQRLGLENAYGLYKMQRLDVPAKIPAEFLPTMAEYFGEPPPGLPFWSPAGLLAIAVPVEGAVEPLIFRPAGEPEAGPLVAMIKPAGNARFRAFEVRGDSMVDAGIPAGAIIVGQDFEGRLRDLEPPAAVVIERERGGLVERSVLALAKYADRIEFQPRSSSGKHKAVVVPATGGRSLKDREGYGVRILAVVDSVISKPIP
jgi:hypothetical protein